MNIGWVLNQTMLRIKDPERSVPFYRDILGMTLLDRYDFPPMKFSLYFMGYPDASDGPIPTDPAARAKWVFERKALLEVDATTGHRRPTRTSRTTTATPNRAASATSASPCPTSTKRASASKPRRRFRETSGRRHDERARLHPRPGWVLDRDPDVERSIRNDQPTRAEAAAETALPSLPAACTLA
jgi:catechol 2,3-dioxygenase-like lactoylglutathione lyase family enzyme